jgi:hypothetical protein
MSRDPKTLPDDLAAAVDRWLEGGGETALDALELAVESHPELDGDMDRRGAALGFALLEDDLGLTAAEREDVLDLVGRLDAGDEDGRWQRIAAELAAEATEAPEEEAEREGLSHDDGRVSVLTPRRGRRPIAWMAAATALAAAVLLMVLPLTAQPLVTASEAVAPLLDLPTRGAVDANPLSPRLTLVAPADGVVGRRPFDLVLRAEPGAAGVSLDHGSLKVVYLRGGGVDLTTRLGGTWQDGRYVAKGLSLPPGTHPLEITLSDEEQEARSIRVVLTR